MPASINNLNSNIKTFGFYLFFKLQHWVFISYFYSSRGWCHTDHTDVTNHKVSFKIKRLKNVVFLYNFPPKIKLQNFECLLLYIYTTIFFGIDINNIMQSSSQYPWHLIFWHLWKIQFLIDGNHIKKLLLLICLKRTGNV
jgi:hypothetical protein